MAGCGGLATAGATAALDATSDATADMDGSREGAFEDIHAKTEDADAGSKPAGDADAASSRPCPDGEGGLQFQHLPTCDGTNQYQICSYFEGTSTCVDGQWLGCSFGAAPDLCLSDAAEPEGLLCCPYYYSMPGYFVPADPSCCIAGIQVSCTKYHIVYQGRCPTADAGPADAPTDAPSDSFGD